MKVSVPITRGIESLFGTRDENIRVLESGLSIKTCLRNQDLYEQVSQSRERAAEAFNIDSTPTFFINGRKLTGELSIVDFDKAIEPQTK